MVIKHQQFGAAKCMTLLPQRWYLSSIYTVSTTEAETCISTTFRTTNNW